MMPGRAETSVVIPAHCQLFFGRNLSRSRPTFGQIWFSAAAPRRIYGGSTKSPARAPAENPLRASTGALPRTLSLQHTPKPAIHVEGKRPAAVVRSSRYIESKKVEEQQQASA